MCTTRDKKSDPYHILVNLLVWHLQKSNGSWQTTVDYSEPNQSQLLDHCCSYYPAIDLVNLPGIMIRSSLDSLEWKTLHSQSWPGVTLTFLWYSNLVHLDLLLKAIVVCSTEDIILIDLGSRKWLYKECTCEANVGQGKNICKIWEINPIKIQDPAKLVLFLRFQKFVTC